MRGLDSHPLRFLRPWLPLVSLLAGLDFLTSPLELDG